MSTSGSPQPSASGPAGSASAPSIFPPRKRACDSCYKRKIHCDGATPHCNWCQHHGVACTFLRPVRPRKSKVVKKRKGDDALAQRIERLEALVSRTTGIRPGQPDDNSAPASPSSLGPPTHQHEPADSVAASTPSVLDAAPSAAVSPASSAAGPAMFAKMHFAGHQLGEINSYNGIPFFSSSGRRWIREKTGTEPCFTAFGNTLWENQQHSTHRPIKNTSSEADLPPIEAVDKYFELFKTTTFRFVFPVVEVELFQDTIDVAYSEAQAYSPADSASAKACVLAFTALMNFFEGCLEDNPIDGEYCAMQAQQLIPQLLIPSLMNLQVFIMLTICRVMWGDIQLAMIYQSHACRIAFMCGAHIISHTKLNSMWLAEGDNPVFRTQNQLRKLFWLCYSLDKDIFLRSGLPPNVVDDYCDVSLPDDYEQQLTRKWEIDPSATDDYLMLFLPGDLRLSLIKGKTVKLLYAANSLQKSDMELLRDIMELDEDLENWRVSVTPEARPSLSLAGNAQASADMMPPKRMHIIVIHFEYYYIMATIHRATSRCKAWGNGAAVDLDGVSSSLELCVQASRSTLIYLRDSIDMMMGEAFWMVLFYPMTAIVTIFCNILAKPTESQAQSDLSLLRTAPDLIKKMRQRRLTPNEAMHMSQVEDFIMELIRLGRAAVHRAQPAQGGGTALPPPK